MAAQLETGDEVLSKAVPGRVGGYPDGKGGYHGCWQNHAGSSLKMPGTVYPCQGSAASTREKKERKYGQSGRPYDSGHVLDAVGAIPEVGILPDLISAFMNAVGIRIEVTP